MNVNIPKIKKPVAVPMKMGRIVKRMKSGARAMKKGRTDGKQGPENIIFYNSKEINFPYGGGPGGPGQGGQGGAGSGAGMTEEMRLKGSGVKIDLSPLTSSVLGSPISSDEKEMLRNIRMTYPLIPHEPKTMERVFAYAKIYWDEKRNCMVYLVVEPHLTPQDERLIEQIKKDMEERLDIDFFKLGEVKAKELVVQEIGKILLSKSIDRRKMEIIQYYVQRDIIGLGKIEPLMKDANIEDISCDGHGIPIYIYHRNSLLGSIITNVMFSDGDELDSFAMKLAQKGGKSISVAEPLVDGSLPDGSRVQATLGTDIARRGSNFTIRKFTDKPLTPVHMMEYGTVDSTVMAYLWLAIEYRKSILISGGTATGKTSFLNALSLFIKPSLKIVSIEDTPELRLPHPHWIPEVARTPIATEGKTGEVSLFDLLRESLRQRPDYIIVGEVRGKEAFVLFQQIASIPPEEKILILNDSHLKHVPIEAAMGRRFSTFSVDPVKETFHIAPVRETIRHSPVKELYKIKTRRGREVTVTSAHSVFTYDNGLVPIMVKDMKVGDRIAIPARLPSGYNDIEHIDLMELDGIRVYSPGLIKEASRKLGFEKASKIAGFTTISNYYGVNNCALPSESFIRLMEAAGIDYAKQMEKISVRFQRNSTPSEPKLKITPELLRLIGYYISEGSLNKAYRNNTISIYNSNERILEDMRKCITKVTGKRPKERVTKGFSFATELSFSHKTIYELFRQKCGQRSYQRKVPDFILGLSKEKIGEMLSAMYTGDGHLRKKSFEYATSSRQLANDVLILLSAFGIVGSIEMAKGTNLDVYKIVFYRSEFQKRFLEYVKPLKKIPQLKKPVKTLEKDIFMDIIKSIERITTEKEVDVYDLCVPGYQNFIGGFGGILLHNTGHSGLATIHAASLPQLLDRLTTPPISLPPTLIENIDIIVFLTQVKIGDKYLRRANEVMEVKGTSGDKPVTESVFKWKPISDIFEHTGKSVVIENISRMTGLTEKSMMDEIRARKSVLDWMHEKKMFDYRDVAKIINGYYSDPERILNLVESI